MIRFFVITTFLLIAITQSLSFPWLAISGNQIPLVIISLVVISYQRPQLIILSAIASGFGFDLASVNPIGFWAIFYGISGIALQRLLTKPRLAWWWRVVWALGVIAILPLYAQLANSNHLTLQYWPQFTLAPLLFTAVVVGLICWYIQRQEQKT